jgi:DNA-binding MarR family transcriptional regulator
MASANPYTAMASRQLRTLARLRELHQDMTLLQASFLFYVAANPGVTQRRAYEALDTTDSNAARTLAILSEFGGRNVEPLNLIAMKTNPNDRREKLLELSPKGKRLMDDIMSYHER